MATLKANPAPAPPPAHPLTWVGLTLALVPLLVRASVNITTFPSWDLDPLLYPIPTDALTPAGSMLGDAITLLGAAILLFAASRRAPLHIPLLLLGLIGAAGVILHGWVLGPTAGSLGQQRIGASWISAIVGAVAIWHAARDAQVRRVAVGIVLGFCIVLAMLGALQVLWIHRQTVTDFQADPDRMLAAHGWSPDSPMARSFIRRLMQPEATGWFGLSNVYATFTAAACAAGIALAWHHARAAVRDSTALAGAVALAMAGAAGLYFAHSKGGYFAAAAGAGVFVVLAFAGRLLARHRAIPGLLGVAAIAGPIILILVRGSVGERIGELSLLFRSFYIEAAVRIFAMHPVVGVGPDGFQRAFTAVKPALCPEEVSSPHGIVFDWIATLGVLGIAWVCLLLRWAWSASAQAGSPSDSAPASATTTPPLDRTTTRVALLIPAAATIVATYIEAAMTTPDMALIRVGGLIAWCLAAVGIARAITSDRGVRIALAAGAAAAIAHAQIDVAASLPSSVGLWAALLALAAAPWETSHPRTSPTNAVSLAAIPALAAAGLAVMVAFAALGPVRAWERHLADAAVAVRPLAEFTERLRALQRPPRSWEVTSPPDTIDAVARDLASTLGHPKIALSPTPASIDAAMRELEATTLPRAASELEAAFDAEPSDRKPLREASRLFLRLAERAFDDGDLAGAERAAGAWQQAGSVLRIPSDAGNSISPPATPANASDLHWLASVHEHAATLTHDPKHWQAAIDTRTRIVPLDPYNLDNARHIVRDAQAAGDASLAKQWARKCLDLDPLMRLDKDVKGLSPTDRAELERLAQ